MAFNWKKAQIRQIKYLKWRIATLQKAGNNAAASLIKSKLDRAIKQDA